MKLVSLVSEIKSYCSNVSFLKFWTIFFYLLVLWNRLHSFDRAIPRSTSGSYCHTVDRPVSNENFKSSRPYRRSVAEATRDLRSRRSTDRVLSRPFLFGACGCHLEKWLPKILNKHCCYPVQHLSPENPYFLSSLLLLSDASLYFLKRDVLSCLLPRRNSWLEKIFHGYHKKARALSWRQIKGDSWSERVDSRASNYILVKSLFIYFTVSSWYHYVKNL